MAPGADGMGRCHARGVRRVLVIGGGRAGGSLAGALKEVEGYEVLAVLGRHAVVADAAGAADVVVVATPDSAIAEVATSVRPGRAVMVHLSGSLGLDVLDPHERRASLHPLVPLPDPQVGARRLLAGATFAVSGDPAAEAMARALGGAVVEVDEEHRVAYHAAACIASNHLVALLASAEAVALEAGVPLSAYLDLVRATVDNVAELGPARAVTGPAARGDAETLERHRAVLPPEEREAYDALVRRIQRLVSG